ncbi:MAG: hypothetical protein CBC35_09835 [Planctomycetes bacterium TMED75]|nr:hypothetical protein [Planctomycetaceae bacterium]OUU91260.1 MAG: hypothetical protein CBC35_09835 [Planctomycetes bacterium TMED75]
MTSYRIPRTVFLVLLASLSAGCGNPHRQVPGTDIPKVPQLELTKIEATEGSKSRMIRGKVIFEGPIFDALERIRWSTGNFEHSGWTLESITGTPQKGTGIFFKDSKQDSASIERVATLVVTANRRKGTAVLEFSSRPRPVEKQPDPGAKPEASSDANADDVKSSSTKPAGSS